MAMLFKEKEKPISKIVRIPLNMIRPNPAQPRTRFSEDELIGLAVSIKENGVLQPVTVRKTDDGYQLIAGERRLRAARLAGLYAIPAVIVEKTDEESSILAVMENIQRCDLSCFEQARALRAIMDKAGITQEELARRLGKSQSTVANKLRLLKLSDAVIKKAAGYDLNERQVRALLRLPEEMRENAADVIHERGLNVSQTDEYITRLLSPPAPPKKRVWQFRQKQLYINSINKTLDTMKKSGVRFDSQRRVQDGYLEYIIRIPQDE